LRSRDYVQMKDIMPTLLDLMGIKTKLSFDGRSLRPLTQGKPRVQEPEFYITEATWMRKHGWRTPEWKLIQALEPDFHFKPEIELYNLVNDPGENVNLVDDPACASLAAELKARLQAWQKDCPPLPTIKGLSTTQGGPPAEGQVKTRRQQLRLRPNKKE
jgi:arylsulfatase A-like enzyme